jgi:hypothetical protein
MISLKFITSNIHVKRITNDWRGTYAGGESVTIWGMYERSSPIGLLSMASVLIN